MKTQTKDKIINDPIYGFISLDDSLILKLIDHPYFQRLRKISQLGLSYLVYPGATHSRFNHALGCMHLMKKVIYQLKNKGQIISKIESRALKIAILLHDIGHGPFSHALENSIVTEISHENLSLCFMKAINEDFNGELQTAIDIFNNKYKKRFLHQLVSSQLDMDRLDYLKRDSFFSGVVEGNIGVDRLINMMNIANNSLVVEEKGIYSIEKFLIARRFMYWQVYLHKTVVSAENMLIKILKRVKSLIMNNSNIYVTKSLKIFLEKDYTIKDFNQNTNLIKYFSNLDDYEIYTCLKHWEQSKDFVLSNLSYRINNRKLLKVKICNKKISESEKHKLIESFCNKNKCSQEEAGYFIFSDKLTNDFYNNKSKINILLNNGKIKDFEKVSDQFDATILNKSSNKYFLCYSI